MNSISQIQKRNGITVLFDAEKIITAIYHAAQSVGGRDKAVARDLSMKVLQELEQTFANAIPTVEQVQDIIEKVLIKEGHAKTAKAYILYRNEHAALRKEKMIVLEKEDSDEVDKAFDLNALRVLKARYLRKDERGRTIETPKQLFTRVAVHAALPDIFYDHHVFDLDKQQPQHESIEFDCEAHDNKYHLGKYALNQYHLDAIKRMWERANTQGTMKVPFSQILSMMEQGTFNIHEKTIDDFYNVMVARKFMPNTPAIANFGNVLGMGSACFVIDIEDSIDDIMEKLKQTAIVFKAGGGMGYNFSKLRPEGDFVSSTGGVASGPLSFMRMFDTMTEVIKQGGIRRGANMGILNSNHPDIEKFITIKAGNKSMKNFNISVLIMPDFWEHYEKNMPYPLRNPRTGDVVKHVNPRELFDRIVYQAWESAEPGVIFFDKVNAFNPFFKHLGPIVTTNPCGEVLLYGNESCNLGSVNVWAFTQEDDKGNVTVDWEGMKKTVMTCTKLLDNVIDVNKFPLKAIEDMTLATRKIGLGVMGVADLLYELGLPYNSEEGRAFMERLMEFINYYSKVESIELAKERGPMLYNDKSFYTEGMLPFAGFLDRKSWHFDWDKVAGDFKKYGSRNGYTTVIAPTGSISMIAGTSSGIEPVYALAFEKNVKVGSFFYVDPVFEKVLRKEGLYSEALMEKVITSKGSIAHIPEIPERVKKIFKIALDTTPEEHIRALAAFQKWTDSSISKTNNFPADATVEDMRASYILAYQLGCKDVTVFRDTSIKEQVLVSGKTKSEHKNIEPERISAAAPKMEAPAMVAIATTNGATMQGTAHDAGQGQSAGQIHVPNFKGMPTTCPECKVSLKIEEGCVSCPQCGWGLCT